MAAAAVLSLSFAVLIAEKRRRPLSMPLAASGAAAVAANEVIATGGTRRAVDAA